jgi:hypothetical protein
VKVASTLAARPPGPRGLATFFAEKSPADPILPRRGKEIAAGNPRAGWDAAFAAMALQGDGALLDGQELVPTRWDEEEWEWR